jgi:hypothetical protein
LVISAKEKKANKVQLSHYNTPTNSIELLLSVLLMLFISFKNTILFHKKETINFYSVQNTFSIILIFTTETAGTTKVLLRATFFSFHHQWPKCFENTITLSIKKNIVYKISIPHFFHKIIAPLLYSGNNKYVFLNDNVFSF